MNIIGLLIVSILMFSCASSQNRPSYSNVNNIKNEDFKPVKQVQYTRDSDQLNGIKSPYSEALNSESLDRVFKYDGDLNVKGELEKASEYCHERDFSSAHKLFKSISRKYLKNPIYWNIVGICYSIEEKRRKALLFYNKALSLKPDYAPALNNLGVMYMKERDYSRALVAFRKARKFNNFSKTPRYNLANLYLSFGIYDQAINELTVLYGNGTKDIDVLSMLATAYLMQNNFKKSIEHFEKIDNDFYEKPNVGLNRALAYHLAGNKEQAIDAFKDVELGKEDKSWTNYYKDIQKKIGVQ